MNRLDQDEELKKIIEHAYALRRECLAFNRNHDYQLDIVTLFTRCCPSNPIRINVENMPKEDCRTEETRTGVHYYHKIGEVECWDIVSKGENHG